MNTADLIAKTLQEIGFSDQPGAILYSGNETIRKGNFYFLGANPGGQTENHQEAHPDTLENHLLRKNISPEHNEILCGNWQTGNNDSTKPGQALLQRRIQFLFSELNINLREVLSTNLVFVRSRTLDDFHLSWNDAADKCWNIHEILLAAVCPDVIITHGQEANNYIRQKIDIESTQEFPVKSANETKYFYSTKGVLQLKNVKKKIILMSVPHLARFKVDAMGADHQDAYDCRPAIAWMKQSILRHQNL